MDRHRTYGPGDDAPLKDGDGEFVGVDMQRDPAQVAPGYVSFARNYRFDGRKARPRRGLQLLKWANSYAAQLPLQFPIRFVFPAGWGDVLAAGTYADAESKEWVVIATSDAIHIGKSGYPMQRIELPPGVTLEDPVYFQQAGQTLYLFRGATRPKLQWQRVWLTSAPWVQNVVAVEVDDIGDGTEELPDAATAVLAADRLWVPVGRDEFAYSDLFDFVRFHPVLSRQSLDAGNGEFLRRLWPFAGKTMLAFKNRSVYLMAGVTGDLSELTRTDDPITREIGLKASLSLAEVGKDVWYLSDTGVYTVRQVASAEQQTAARPLPVALPVSEPIQPLIERINWAAAEQAVAAVWNDKYYLAVPLDGSAQNNAVLVYDIRNGAWAGYDDGELIKPKAWVKATVYGRQRLLMVDYTGHVYVYEEHLDGDEGSSGFVDIATQLRTRGYQCQDAGDKLFDSATLDLETWKPTYSIGAVVPGVTG